MPWFLGCLSGCGWLKILGIWCFGITLNMVGKLVFRIVGCYCYILGVVARTPISAVNLPVTHVPGKLTARRTPSCVFALRRQSGTLSCVNALEDRAEQRLVFSHESLSEPLCLSLPLERPDWIVYS
ncbi:hypothetical protein BD560DRAFT_493104 [Blakeslea trispora]|nr:hypothetical protein BD560DRAFT_493104 [Blakeslea trispora]